MCDFFVYCHFGECPSHCSGREHDSRCVFADEGGMGSGGTAVAVTTPAVVVVQVGESARCEDDEERDGESDFVFILYVNLVVMSVLLLHEFPL